LLQVASPETSGYTLIEVEELHEWCSKGKVKVKMSLCFLTKHHAMNMYWEVEVQCHLSTRRG
jgi:hypothetical protein